MIGIIEDEPLTGMGICPCGSSTKIRTLPDPNPTKPPCGRHGGAYKGRGSTTTPPPDGGVEGGDREGGEGRSRGACGQTVTGVRSGGRTPDAERSGGRARRRPRKGESAHHARRVPEGTRPRRASAQGGGGGAGIEGGGRVCFRMDSELSGRSQHRLLLYDRLIGLMIDL